MKKQQSGFTVVEIVIVIAIVAALAGIGWFTFNRVSKNEAENNVDDTSESTEPAITESGSCFGVSKDTIKSILGTPAENLQDLSDTKVQDIGNGDTARTCVYTFAPGATATNSFTMDVGTYASQANLDESQKYIESTGGAVEGLGDSATYEAKDAAISSSRDFVLTIRQDLKIYKFGISQPLDALSFNDASAQRALIQIAQAATL